MLLPARQRRQLSWLGCCRLLLEIRLRGQPGQSMRTATKSTGLTCLIEMDGNSPHHSILRCLLRVDFAIKENSLCLLNKLQLSINGSTSSPFMFNNALPTAARPCPINQKIHRVSAVRSCRKLSAGVSECLVYCVRGCPNSQTHLSEVE